MLARAPTPGFGPPDSEKPPWRACAGTCLIDASLIGMLVGPALMSLLSRRAWTLPRWVDRITPVVDVEGASLTRRLDTNAPWVLERV